MTLSRRGLLGASSGLALTAALPFGWTGAGATTGMAAVASEPDVVVRSDLTIRPRSAWAEGLAPLGPMPSEDVRFLLVHHTASPNDYTPDQVAPVLRSAYRLHTGPTKGWPDVAYNFFVDRFGIVWEGRAGSLAGAVRADATGGSQGFAQLVCLVGDFTNQMPTGAAIDALARTLAWLADWHDIDTKPGATARFTSRGSNRWQVGSAVTASTISGHRDMSQTACPGNTFYPYVRTQLPERVQSYRGAVTSTLVVTGYGSAREGLVTTSAPQTWVSERITGRRPVGIAAASTGHGGWVAFADGGVRAFGDAVDHGSMAGRRLNRPVVGIAAARDGGGYWLVADDGGIFSFGTANFHGSTGAMTLNRPIVGIASSSSPEGYWLVADDGGVFAFDAPFLGSMGGVRLNEPVIGIVAANDGSGYRLVASDGGVFSFGTSGFDGSAANSGARWAGLASCAGGYVLVDTSGNTTVFGTVDVAVPTSMKGAVSMTLTSSGDGLLVASVKST